MAKPMEEARATRILLVEDEYMIAQDMAHEIRTFGAEVLGPVGTVGEAMRLVDSGTEFDAAFLDLNLNGDFSYPLVDVLRDRGVRIIFTPGYDEHVIPQRYADIPRCAKPVTRLVLQRMMETVAG